MNNRSYYQGPRPIYSDQYHRPRAPQQSTPPVHGDAAYNQYHGHGQGYGQAQVIDYENKRLEGPQLGFDGSSRGYEDAYQGGASSAQDIPPSSFGGALSNISLTDLKNTLGGQLETLLSRGLAQPANATQHPQDDDRQEQYMQRAYDGHKVDLLPRYGDDRGLIGRTFSGAQSHVQGPGDPYGPHSSDQQRRPLFPIPADGKPKSILKKSILKKPESAAEQIQPSTVTNETVDEDDFLYGEQSEKSHGQVTATSDFIPATQPDTQKIISNPAFTALLKSIGLDDINIADRVKEKQAEERHVVTKRNVMDRASNENEQGFGIDQSASFLSSAVVLDDLLKLKQPQKDATPAEDVTKQRPGTDTGGAGGHGSTSTTHLDRYRGSMGHDRHHSDSRTDARRDGDRRDMPRSSDRFASSHKPPDRSPALRHRSRSPAGRRRSRSPGFRSGSSSGYRRSRSPASRGGSSSGYRRSRSPAKSKRKSRSPADGDMQPSRHRSRSPKRQLRESGSGEWDGPELGLMERRVKENFAATRRTNISSSLTRSNSASRRSATPERDSEILPRQLREQPLRNASPPPSDQSERPVSSDLHELLSKIPRDVKLTRAQFEELMAAHRAQQAASAKEHYKMEHSPHPAPKRRREASHSPEARTSTNRNTDEGIFKNFKLVVRSGSPKRNVNAVTDDDLLDEKSSVKASSAPFKEESGDRRVVRRIGTLGSATLEKRVMETDKEKYMREFEKAELEKAFGGKGLLPKLSEHEISNIHRMIDLNKDKLKKLEKKLIVLQSNQSEVVVNLRYASVGEQYHLDKTLEQNIRLQNGITSDIKDLKKLVRDDELTLAEQYEQQRKVKDIAKKKLAAAKAFDNTRIVPSKQDSPPPEKQDRKYRRAMEDKMMAKTTTENEVKCATKDGKQTVSKPGTKVVEYYDPGSHWCKACNFVAFKLYAYLEHLQTSGHMKKRERIGKPWQPEEVTNPPRQSLISRQEMVVQPMKGAEFIHPVDAYYCLICNYFTGDKDSVDHHLKSESHHKQYQTYVTDNPMYEKRYKLDKEIGIEEAKKLEAKRNEEQERKREAEREDLERQREMEKRREREKREAEERRKKEKTEKLKAKKQAEVLAITRGRNSGSDEVEDVQVVVETAQERIKRQLLEKTRAKKGGGGDQPGGIEAAEAKSLKLAQDAKDTREMVKAKAAEISEAVYGPKQTPDVSSTSEPGLFLPEIPKPKVYIGKIPSKKAADASRTEAKAPAEGPTNLSVSPFVQKMMEMEKSGEMITTATVKAQTAAAVRPQLTSTGLSEGTSGHADAASASPGSQQCIAPGPSTLPSAPQAHLAPQSNRAPQALPGNQNNIPSQANMGPSNPVWSQNISGQQANNMGPRSNMGSRPNMIPQSNMGPRPNMVPQSNMGPRPNMAPQSNMGPRPNMVPQPNVGHQPNIGHQFNMGRMNVSPHSPAGVQANMMRQQPAVGQPSLGPQAGFGPRGRMGFQQPMAASGHQAGVFHGNMGPVRSMVMQGHTGHSHITPPGTVGPQINTNAMRLEQTSGGMYSNNTSMASVGQPMVSMQSHDGMIGPGTGYRSARFILNSWIPGKSASGLSRGNDNPSVASQLAEESVRPPGTAPSATGDNVETESDSSDTDDSGGECNTDHSFSLSGLLSQFSADSKKDLVANKPADPQSQSMTAIAVDSDPAVTVDSDPAVAVDSDPATAVDSDPAVAVDSDPAVAVDSDPAVAVDSDPATAVDSDPAVTVDSDPAVAVDSDPATAVDSDPAVAVDSDPAVAVDSDPATAVDSDPATAVDSDPAVAVDSDPAVAVDSDPAVAVDSDTAVAVDSDPAVAVDSDPAVAVDSDPATTVESDPATAVDSDPAMAVDSVSAIAAAVDSDPATAVDNDPVTVVDSVLALIASSEVDTREGGGVEKLSDSTTIGDTKVMAGGRDMDSFTVVDSVGEEDDKT